MSAFGRAGEFVRYVQKRSEFVSIGDRMRPEEIRNEIDGLELSEKLLLVEDTWDSIASGNSVLPMPEWQKIELEKRSKDYKDGNLKLHEWKEVHEGLRDKYK